MTIGTREATPETSKRGVPRGGRVDERKWAHPPWLAIVLLSLFSLTACVSPESTRARGGGPGADPLNHAQVVKMHEGSSQYWKTPLLIDQEFAALEPAEQARQLSRP